MHTLTTIDTARKFCIWLETKIISAILSAERRDTKTWSEEEQDDILGTLEDIETFLSNTFPDIIDSDSEEST